MEPLIKQGFVDVDRKVDLAEHLGLSGVRLRERGNDVIKARPQLVNFRKRRRHRRARHPAPARRRDSVCRKVASLCDATNHRWLVGPLSGPTLAAFLQIARILRTRVPKLSLRDPKSGAPGRIRTRGLWLRRTRKGVNRGQHGAAAPDFIGVPANARQPETTPRRYALSVICQSRFRCCDPSAEKAHARRRQRLSRAPRSLLPCTTRWITTSSPSMR